MTTTLMRRQEFALCFITMSAIFIIFNDADSDPCTNNPVAELVATA
jgi:hypothetical protein